MRSLVVVLLISIFPLSSSAAPIGSSDLEMKLHTPVSEYVLSANTLLEALSNIAAQFNLRMGVEWIGDVQHRRTIQLSFKDVTRPQAFLAGNQTFLDQPLKSFEVRDEYVMGANLRLMELLRNQTRSLLPQDIPTERSGIGGSFGTGLGDRRVSFELENVRVRDVLDRFVLSADFQMWVVTYVPDKGVTVAGDTWTVSIFNWELTEKYQPVWDLLVRGFDPTAKAYKPEWVPKEEKSPTKN